MSGTDANDHDTARGATESDADGSRVVGEQERRYETLLRLRTEALNRVAAENERLRAGEADSPGNEAAVPTPAEWLRRFNDADPDRRLLVAERAIANSDAIDRNIQMRLRWGDLRQRAEFAESALTEAREQLSRLREAVEGLRDDRLAVNVPSAEVTSWSHYAGARLAAVLADVTPAVQGDTGDAPPAEQEAGEAKEPCPDCGTDPDDDTLHADGCRRIFAEGDPREDLQFGPPWKPWREAEGKEPLRPVDPPPPPYQPHA